MIPKPGGVRKGWRAMLMVASDGELRFHEKVVSGTSKRERTTPTFSSEDPAAHIAASLVLQLGFSRLTVSDVVAADAIHAGTKQIPRLFKLAYRGHENTTVEVLVLCTDPDAKQLYVMRIQELLVMTKGKEPGPGPISCGRLLDSHSLPEVKRVHCAARIGTRLLIGTANGLFTLSSTSAVTGIGDMKKVTQIDLLPTQHSFVACGSKKQSQLRLFGINGAIRGGDEGLKIPESKGAHLFSTGDVGMAAGRTGLVFAVRNWVKLCEVTLQSYKVIGEIELVCEPSVMAIVDGRICVAHDAVFTIYDWDQQQPLSLVSKSDPNLRFLFTMSDYHIELEPVSVFHIASGHGGGSEYLLCFNLIGVFVDAAGNRSRDLELRWAARSCHFVLMYPHLMCCSDDMLQV